MKIGEEISHIRQSLAAHGWQFRKSAARGVSFFEHLTQRRKIKFFHVSRKWIEVSSICTAGIILVGDGLPRGVGAQSLIQRALGPQYRPAQIASHQQ